MAELIPLTSVDKLFFRLETPQTPIHTASLSTYRKPSGASSDYTQELFGKLSRQLVIAPPFNYLLRQAGRKMAWQVLAPDEIDLDYHVRHSALPNPGGERELGELISRLHSIHLDRSRPLWEFHLIENLDGNRFATYMKMHHALADGGAVIKILSDSFSRSPTERSVSPWARMPSQSAAAEAAAQACDDRQRPGELFATIRKMLRSLLDRPQQGLVGPYAAPPSPLNVAVTAPRRYATQQFKIERLKAVGKAAGGATVNDVFVAMVSGALRRYLMEIGSLPQRSLTAMIPVAIEREGEDLGNAVSIIFASLATTVEDPAERLRIIGNSVAENRRTLAQLTPAQKRIVAMITALPMIFAKPRTPKRPMFNLVISNVPGPRENLWFDGAEVEALYPCSVVNQTYAINITARGYADTINIGFIGARDALPHFQHIAVYTEAALEELEEAFQTRSAKERLSVAS